MKISLPEESQVKSLNLGYQSGGNIFLDKITLKSGKFIVIGTDDIAVFRSEKSFEDGDSSIIECRTYQVSTLSHKQTELINTTISKLESAFKTLKKIYGEDLYSQDLTSCMAWFYANRLYFNDAESQEPLAEMYLDGFLGTSKMTLSEICDNLITEITDAIQISDDDAVEHVVDEFIAFMKDLH